MLAATFYEVWIALEAQAALYRKEGAVELKAAIIRRLIDLAANGTTQPEEMKAEVLKTLPLGLKPPSQVLNISSAFASSPRPLLSQA